MIVVAAWSLLVYNVVRLWLKLLLWLTRMTSLALFHTLRRAKVL